MYLALFRFKGKASARGTGIVTQDNPNAQAEGQTEENQAAAQTEPQTVGGAEKVFSDPREELAARRDQIVTRVKNLGWRPFQDVALDVLGRIVAAADGFLTGLEGGDNPRKKR